LEVIGFKSFPDKTALTFETGITAIVGPNGSGKSNVSTRYAGCWASSPPESCVEAKMEDVIFGGGTLKRGPVGSAQVSLTIRYSDGRFL
jgi:chromosome segregation protein